MGKSMLQLCNRMERSLWLLLGQTTLHNRVTVPTLVQMRLNEIYFHFNAAQCVSSYTHSGSLCRIHLLCRSISFHSSTWFSTLLMWIIALQFRSIYSPFKLTVSTPNPLLEGLWCWLPPSVVHGIHPTVWLLTTRTSTWAVSNSVAVIHNTAIALIDPSTFFIKLYYSFVISLPPPCVDECRHFWVEQ